MSRATFAWSGALGAQLRDEGTEVIFLFPAVSLCFGSLSPSLLWSHPPPSTTLSLFLTLSPPLCSQWIPSGSTAGDYYTHRQIRSLSISLCPLPPSSPTISSSPSSFPSPPPPMLSIHFYSFPPSAWMWVFVCVSVHMHRSSSPLPFSSSSHLPPSLSLSPSPFLQSI